MPTERERKFRVTRCDASRLPDGERIRQGYLSFDPVVRVRVRGDRAFLTVKGPGAYERREYEYPIPVSEAEEMLSLCPGVIDKTRYVLGPLEVDVFEGALAGLVLAEAEGVALEETIAPPEGMEWVEVTGDPRYLNSNLARFGL